MKITKDTQIKARRLMRLCMVNGLLDELRVRRVSQMILEKKPRNFIALLIAFKDLVRLAVERRMATVTSAIPLTDGERTQIISQLQSRYGADIQFHWIQDAALIAGIHIQVGDNVIDGSLRTRIQKIHSFS